MEAHAWVAGLVPGQGMCQRQPIDVSLTHLCFSLSLSLSHVLSLKINKFFKKILVFILRQHMLGNKSITPFSSCFPSYPLRAKKSCFALCQFAHRQEEKLHVPLPQDWSETPMGRDCRCHTNTKHRQESHSVETPEKARISHRNLRICL